MLPTAWVMETTLPLTSESTTNKAFSDSSSTRAVPTSTASPTFTNQFATVTSVVSMPIFGTRISVFIGRLSPSQFELGPTHPISDRALELFAVRQDMFVQRRTKRDRYIGPCNSRYRRL